MFGARPMMPKGKGKGKQPRFRKVLRDNIQGLTKPSLLRIAARAGVKRLNVHTYEELRGIAKKFMEGVIANAVTYSTHEKRKTIATKDIVRGLKSFSGTVLCGYPLS